MYAVIQDRGHQYKAAPGTRLTIDRSQAAVGATVELPVLLLANEAGVKVGAPYVAGAKAVLKVIEHQRGEKITIGKFKRRKHNLRRHGFRSEQTVVEVVSISG
jgi:large subunit ribosomal protein L21